MLVCARLLFCLTRIEQRNGLQFASGETLSVEPAHSNGENSSYYSQGSVDTASVDDGRTTVSNYNGFGARSETGYYGPPAAESTGDVRDGVTEQGPEDDLDDFFALIE